MSIFHITKKNTFNFRNSVEPIRFTNTDKLWLFWYNPKDSFWCRYQYMVEGSNWHWHGRCKCIGIYSTLTLYYMSTLHYKKLCTVWLLCNSKALCTLFCLYRSDWTNIPAREVFCQFPYLMIPLFTMSQLFSLDEGSFFSGKLPLTVSVHFL